MMTFRTPQLLWLLAAVPLAAAFLLARERLRELRARRLVSERLRGVSNLLRSARPWLLTGALLAAVVALAGPHAGFITVPILQRQSNRVIALDVSNSMAAEDVGTSRLAAGKALARRLIEAHPGRVALLEFESSPEVISPLTNDSDAVVSLLDSVQPGEVGDPGSDLGTAVLMAERLVEADPTAAADVVVISDGEDQGRHVDDAIRRAKERGIRISSIMLGSSGGSTIPAGDGGPLKDDNGRIVTTRTHREQLAAMASGTGGMLLENPFAEHALDPLLPGARGGTAKATSVQMPLDRYQWPLALSFALFLCASLVNRGAE